MKKLLPLMIFPYVNLIYLLTMLFLLSSNSVSEDLLLIVGLSLAVIYMVITMVLILHQIYLSLKGKTQLYECAKYNMIVKLLHIPAYIFYFLLGMLGIIMGVWGIVIVLYVMFIDFLTITLSGIYSLASSYQIYKAKIHSNRITLLLAVSNFIYCLDICAAIYYFFIAKSKNIEIEAEDNQIIYDKRSIISIISTLIGSIGVGINISLSEVLYPEISELTNCPLWYQLMLYLSLGIIFLGIILSILFKNRGNTSFMEIMIEAVVLSLGLIFITFAFARIERNVKTFIICFGAILFLMGLFAGISSLIGILKKPKVESL